MANAEKNDIVLEKVVQRDPEIHSAIWCSPVRGFRWTA